MSRYMKYNIMPSRWLSNIIS